MTGSLHRPYRAPLLTIPSILGLTPQAILHHPFGVLDLTPSRHSTPLGAEPVGLLTTTYLKSGDSPDLMKIRLENPVRGQTSTAGDQRSPPGSDP